MDDILKSGIYQIRNLVTGKLYVGSASIFKKRWANHKSTLQRQTHRSILLQRAWNKYGEEAFIFEIIEIIDNPTKKLLEEKEQYWLDFYQSYNPENGYNINQYATSCLGRKLSQETKDKISQATKGRITYIRTEEQKKRLRNKLLGNKLGIGNRSNLGKQAWNKGLTDTRFVINCSICGTYFKQTFKEQQTCRKECSIILNNILKDKSKNIDLGLFEQYVNSGLSAPMIARRFNLSAPSVWKYMYKFLPFLIDKLRVNGKMYKFKILCK